MNQRLATAASLAALLVGLNLPPARAAEGFEWKDTAGKFVDLLHDGRPVARYVHERIDLSSPERREETYKPFHHVYDWEGKSFITKGPGGKYTHHRGIYFGFSKTGYTDASGKAQTVDIWHCKPGKDGQPGTHQTHEEFLEQTADAESATQRLRIAWHGNDGAVFANEERTLRFSFDAAGGLVVDFSSTLTPVAGEVTVDGDPQHAGFHFRASNEVAENTAKQTYYIRPKTGKDAPGKTINWDAKNDSDSTRDLPWKAMSFVVGGKRYTTVYLDRPQNPKPARFSERDYGRFGSYFVAKATEGAPLNVNYRLVIAPGERTMEDCDSLSAAFLK
ncbi:MAG: PmoA family protein [Verrucomicrobiae bacterium]|nr:PmoA family protein [Verrucomicrobiae bacterium]MCP5541285.1 PmoA family protein [Akkermansiaceae bacterium]MCP5550950.1 PmoA family protein [Akkermansiaceae bacterium]